MLPDLVPKRRGLQGGTWFPLEVAPPKAAFALSAESAGNSWGRNGFDGDVEIGIAGGCAYHP